MSKSYQCKAVGPQVRILVEDSNQLPNKIVLPGFLGDGEREFRVEYSGLPMQCHCCRSRNHHAKHCLQSQTDNNWKYPRNKPSTSSESVADTQVVKKPHRERKQHPLAQTIQLGITNGSWASFNNQSTPPGYIWREKTEIAPVQLLAGITGPVTYNIHIIDPNFWVAIDETIPELGPIVARITPLLVRAVPGYALEALIHKDSGIEIQPICSA
jgi:hypothetical protein